MSTLQVSNIHFESTGNNRLQYTGSNSYNLVGGGVTVAAVNTTAISFPASLNVNNFVANSSISVGAVLVANSTVVNATHLSGVAAASYQLNSTLSGNVATLTANNTSFVGTVSAANVVSNAQLSGNLANYVTTTNLNNNLANYVTTTNLTNNLANYQTTAGLSANVAKLAANNTTYFNGQLASFYTNATNITTGTLPYAQIPANIINTTANFTRTGVTTLEADLVLGNSSIAVGLQANGSYGTAGQVLHSNGSATYWDIDDNSGTVTSVGSGDGLTGGPVTTTGSLSVLANTGIIANVDGVFVNAAYIGTLTANNTSFVGTVPAVQVVSNTQLSSNLANYQTTAGLSANVATLTANNTSFVGSVSAANVVSNAQLTANLGNYTTTAGLTTALSFYQTTSGLASNIAPMSVNSATNFTSTSQNSQFNSIGVGTAASGTAGEIRATNEVTAYYSSDISLKTNIIPIENALVKLRSINGVMFDWKDDYIEKRGGEDGYFVRKHDTGIIAQEVEAVLPEVVATKDDGTKAVKYEKMLGLVIQAINELADQVDEIKKKVN